MTYHGSYVWQLRQHVGNAPLLITGVGVFLTDPDGKIWLGRRNDAAAEWAYWGGAVELGQSVTDCARAELREETGLEATELTFIGLHSNPAETTYTYPNGDQVQIINLLFEAPRLGRELRLNDEHTEVAAFALTDLPTPLKSDTRHALKLYQAFKATGQVQLN